MIQTVPTLPPSFPLPPSNADRRSPFAVLYRRRALFAAVVCGFLALVVAATLLSPRSYTTHVKFIAGNEAASESPVNANQTILPVLNAILAASNAQSSETYAEMLRQTPAVERVIEAQKLAISPHDLLQYVKVKPVTNTSILDVGVTWKNPVASAQIANGLADSFVAVRRDLISQQAQSAIDYIGGQLPEAQDKMQRSGAALAEYESKNGIADADQQTQAALTALAALDTKLSALEVDRRQADAELGVVNQQLAATPALTNGGQQTAPNPVLAQLKGQLAQVDVQLRTALNQYTEEHPTVRALRSQEAQLKNELAVTPATIVAEKNTVANPMHQTLAQQGATLKSQVASDVAQIAALKAERARQEPIIRDLPLRAATLIQLKRQAKQDEDVFNALQHKLSEARIAQTTTLSDVSVISRAAASDAEVHPNLLINLAAGLLVAVFLGIGATFVAERIDGSVKTEEDITERLALPVLASIPELPGGPGRNWVRAVTVDAFLQLVTSLRYASSDRLRSIAFTSADANDGKSLVALDTAIALAELTPRVLLVDADLRLPSLHTKLGTGRDPGLSDLLVGTASFEQTVQSTAHSGLDVITAGTKVPNAYALLQSTAFEAFLEDARGRYETIILDTPACGAVVDASVVCARVDGTVYVVASHETDLGMAERGLIRLRNAGVRNVVGAVLNKVSPRRSSIGAYGELTDVGRSFPLPPPRPAGH
ncbi:MAG TPA: polysaccharide biosynthesis tyrosine autokinase [Candidatus Limnocylindria bacterium]|jgi:capsular exopolysaccharide synthesis family protein|nr:polysaccharide biosynthesis tyrosine autokinase [Candidatus Limnocylindria bacterium]